MITMARLIGDILVRMTAEETSRRQCQDRREIPLNNPVTTDRRITKHGSIRPKILVWMN